MMEFAKTAVLQELPLTYYPTQAHPSLFGNHTFETTQILVQVATLQPNDYSLVRALVLPLSTFLS
jgi:hypothetical protein